MAYVLASLLLLVAMLMPASAAAEPIHVQLRLVSGDTLHYSFVSHITVNGGDFNDQTIDYNLGLRLTVGSLFDDGSAQVLEEIDSIDFAGADLGIDTSEYLGRQYSFVAHPDGSSSDFKQVNADQDAPSAGLLLGGATTNFPASGLEVGQTIETPFQLPSFSQTSTSPTVPLRTTLQGLLVEDGRPSAHMKQVFSLPDTETSFGPFGATGTARLNAAGDSSYSLDLGTGWVTRVGGVVAYGVNVQSENRDASLSFKMEYALNMDDLQLVEQ